jgi:hypothetical protein
MSCFTIQRGCSVKVFIRYIFIIDVESKFSLGLYVHMIARPNLHLLGFDRVGL